MCNRTERRASRKMVMNALGAIEAEGTDADDKKYSNPFEFNWQPILTDVEPKKLRRAVWGLVPNWPQRIHNRDEAREFATYTFHCRIENAWERPTWKHLIETHHCLFPMTGYFEYRYIGKTKYPYRIFCSDRDIFCVAGLWSLWENPENGKRTLTFAVITTTPNKLNTLVFTNPGRESRMPVIISKEDEEKWLSTPMSRALVEEMCVPYPDELMEAYTVNRSLGSKNFDPDDERYYQKWEYLELGDECHIKGQDL